MKLQCLQVEGLFGQFDYDISFENEENLKIITGPNGYGKTMLLNIINEFFRIDYDFFNKLNFREIKIMLNGGRRVSIIREKMNSVSATYTDDFDKEQTTDLSQMMRTLNQSYINSNDIYLIKEQRLLRYETPEYEQRGGQLLNVIAVHSIELKDQLSSAKDSYNLKAQGLDRTFPQRLLHETDILSPHDFNDRFNALRSKQETLKKYTLSDNVQEIPEYSDTDAKVLSVYLKDSEKKVAVFDELVQKLDAFTEILNERRFSFKSIKIDREKGFYFQTDKGEPLELTDLSSGEQHEVVLLFELIFRAKPGTLVLIDEPELSLHVTWQRAFIADLLEIMKFQKMQVIVATHSPQIINDRWDLVYNLEKQPA